MIEKEETKVSKASKEESKEEIKKGSRQAEGTRKEETQKEEPKQVQNKPLVHIDKFLAAIAPSYNLSGMHMSGFKAYMQGNHYMKTLQDFVPHLDKYLGRKEDK